MEKNKVHTTTSSILLKVKISTRREHGRRYESLDAIAMSLWMPLLEDQFEVRRKVEYKILY